MRKNILGLCLIVLTLPSFALALERNDYVEATQMVEIYDLPGSNAGGKKGGAPIIFQEIDTAGKGAKGKITAGPSQKWWFIEWDEHLAGWSEGRYLKKYTQPLPPNATWSAKEILADIQAAEAANDPITSLLSEKITEEATKNGFTFINNNLSFNIETPASVVNFKDAGCENDPKCLTDITNFLKINLTLLDVGQCRIPIPEGSLYGARMATGTVFGTFNNAGTYLNFDSTPTKTSFGLNAELDLKIAIDLGLEWCGRVIWPLQCKEYVRNPACPPPICYPAPTFSNPFRKKCTTPSCPLPDMCLIPIPVPESRKESWVDWTTFNMKGKVATNIQIEIDHKLVASTTAGTITVEGDVRLTGSASKLPKVYFSPVRPDTRLIETPIGRIPHAPKSIVLQALVDAINTPIMLAQVFGVDERYVNGELEKALDKQEEKLKKALKEKGPIQIKLPNYNPNDADTLELYAYILDYLRHTLGIFGDVMVDIVNENFTEILYYMLTDNKAAIQNIFTSSATCPVVTKLRQTMPVLPLYKKTGASCSAVDPKTAATGIYYSDASCVKSVNFQGGEFNLFCKDALALPNPNLNHGNAAAWPKIGVEVDTPAPLTRPSSKWALSAGAQLGLGVESIKNNSVPYMKRVNYKEANGCSLEMRVYKKDPNATGLKPLLWIHGGSWGMRGAFIGFEALVSSYTEAGFAVFAPYYRLTGNVDGSRECRNAKWTDVVADVESALTWVKANSALLGAPNTGKIAVAGQSAGGHLAAWLSAYRSTEVSQAMLIYPPADFGDFLGRMQGTGGMKFSPLGTPVAEDGTTKYSWAEAKDIVQNAFGIKDALKENLSSPVVALNSFGDIVKKNGPSNYPPVLILHGGSDALLHHSQAIALCEGYGGSVVENWSQSRTTYKCGNNSYLHLLKEAQHAFEICPAGVAGSVCLAGSPRAALFAADSLRLGRNWLLNPGNVPLPR